jgi:hypothetical protein
MYYKLQPSNMPPRFHTSWLLWTFLLLPNGRNEAVEAFSGFSGEVMKPAAITSKSNAPWRVRSAVGRTLKRRPTQLHAKPERMHENVEGVVYVNDRVCPYLPVPPVCNSVVLPGFGKNVTSSRSHCFSILNFLSFDPFLPSILTPCYAPVHQLRGVQ